MTSLYFFIKGFKFVIIYACPLLKQLKHEISFHAEHGFSGSLCYLLPSRRTEKERKGIDSLCSLRPRCFLFSSSRATVIALRKICMARFLIMITMFPNFLKNTTMPTLLSHHSAHIFKLSIFNYAKFPFSHAII